MFNLESFRNEKVATFIDFYLEHAAKAAEEERYVPVTDEVEKENQAKFEHLRTNLVQPEVPSV